MNSKPLTQTASLEERAQRLPQKRRVGNVGVCWAAGTRLLVQTPTLAFRFGLGGYRLCTLATGRRAATTVGFYDTL